MAWSKDKTVSYSLLNMLMNLSVSPTSAEFDSVYKSDYSDFFQLRERWEQAAVEREEKLKIDIETEFKESAVLREIERDYQEEVEESSSVESGEDDLSDVEETKPISEALKNVARAEEGNADVEMQPAEEPERRIGESHLFGGMPINDPFLKLASLIVEDPEEEPSVPLDPTPHQHENDEDMIKDLAGVRSFKEI